VYVFIFRRRKTSNPLFSELKTFINQHKPRNASRRSTNHKANSATASANSRAKRVVVKPADVPVNHESVSHTSPLNNHDPQAPSSQSKESVSRIEDNKSLPLSESMDPHFARLLSSLTMSAAATPAAGSETPGPIAVSGNPVPKGFTGPNSLSEPLISSQVGVKSDWSSSASSHVPIQSDELSPPFPSPASDNEKSLLNVDLQESETYQPLSPSVVLDARDGESSVHPPRPQPQIAVHSPIQSTARVNTSRRVSTADVSPYLSRATEVPTSAKRLQQLALLESVADESARMTPLLAARTMVPHMRYPLPSPSNPPQPMSMHNLNSAPPCNQTTAHPEGNGPFKPLNPSSGHVNINHDPFQVRARTSQAFHRNPIQPYSGSMSMNQSQLLNIMNGAGPSPVLRSSGYYPSYPYPPFGIANSATIVRPPPQATALGVYQNHGPTLPKVPSISLNPAMPIVLGNGLEGSTNPLLSILNSRVTGLGPFHT
jgi:mRNA-decapping enzyme subunit 2